MEKLIKVYDFEVSALGFELLSCKVFKKGVSWPIAVCMLQIDRKTGSVVQVSANRSDLFGDNFFSRFVYDCFSFVDSPHWRDTVAKQHERVGELFDLKDGSLSPAHNDK